MTSSDLPSSPESARRRGLSASDRVLLLVGLAVAAIMVVATPGTLLDKADHVGYAVCHQIPVRTPFFAGRPLPLCARCSGQFLGALFGLIFLLALGRGRAGRLPPKPVIAVLLTFLALWAFDGFNSYLSFFPSLPQLYEPHNVLRTATGTLQGVALISLVWPFFNVTLWAKTTPEPTLRGMGEAGALLALAALLTLAVSSGWDALLYPLALLSVGGTLLLLTMVNTMLLALLLKREAAASSLLAAAPLLTAGLALALLEVLAINLGRAWLTSRMGLPF